MTDVIILSMTVCDLGIYVDTDHAVSRSADCHSLLFHLVSTAQYPTSVPTSVSKNLVVALPALYRCRPVYTGLGRLHGFMPLSGPTRATRQHGAEREKWD